MAFGKLVDMALAPQEAKDMACMPCAPANDGQPRYPWGLCVSLEDEQLDKLGLDADCEVGDLLDARCMMRVNSVSMNDTTSGKRRRVELQIIMMSVEDEEAEGEEEEVSQMPVRKLRTLSYKTT